MRIKPFRAVRPRPDVAADVASPPYDVLSSDEARIAAAGNDLSFLHVVKPEIDLPEGADIYGKPVYEKARENFTRLRDEGALIQEGTDCLYLYAQRMGDQKQVGVVACCHIEDYENNVIRKHEHTRPDKEDDRTRHVEVLNANAGPVFLTYQDREPINQIVEKAKETGPLYDFTASDGIQHTVWKLDKTDELVALFADIPIAYVADGHHRSASAARVGRERREANPNHTGEEEYNWYLAVLFPASQLQILPYNRCVQDLNGMEKDSFLAAVHDVCAVTEDATPTSGEVGRVSMYLDGRWYGLAWKSAESDDPVAGMDVTMLQDRVLAPILGIGDPRKDPRIDFVGGIRGTKELEQRVDSGRAAVAFSMFPTSVEQLMKVADAGQVMPPKSTWFEPKLRSGLLVHLLD